MEELAKRLIQDGRRLAVLNTALVEAEHDVALNVLPLELCRKEKALGKRVRDWETAFAMCQLRVHMTALNTALDRTVEEPLKKLVSMVPHARCAVTKWEQRLQSKKALGTAQADFVSINETVSKDLPDMVDSRTSYFQPSLEALIKSQVQYIAEAGKVYSELSAHLKNGDKHKEPSLDDPSQIKGFLDELKSLTITTDENI